MKYPTTAKRLKEALYRSGMTARELAISSGVSESSISQYINGTHKPGNISSDKLAAVLNCDPVWLMGFDVPSQYGDAKINYNAHFANSTPKEIFNDRINDLIDPYPFEDEDEYDNPQLINPSQKAKNDYFKELTRIYADRIILLPYEEMIKRDSIRDLLDEVKDYDDEQIFKLIEFIAAFNVKKK